MRKERGEDLLSLLLLDSEAAMGHQEEAHEEAQEEATVANHSVEEVADHPLTADQVDLLHLTKELANSSSETE